MYIYTTCLLLACRLLWSKVVAGGGSYYRQDQHLTLMILFHASSDGKNKEILQEVRITQMNLGDILIN